MSKNIDWGIIHGEGTIECECDQCGTGYSYDFEDSYPDFKSCQEELRESGWISRKINGEWYDFCCEECYHKYIIEEMKNDITK